MNAHPAKTPAISLPAATQKKTIATHISKNTRFAEISHGIPIAVIGIHRGCMIECVKLPVGGDLRWPEVLTI
jgi:hypothetical protein